MIFETEKYDVYHSVRDEFWTLAKSALKPGERPAVAALGPIYEVDPAAELLAPFIRSAQEAGLDPSAVPYLAPEWVTRASHQVRESRFSLWGLQASERDWRDVHDWTRAGLVLEIASRIGIPLRNGSRVHVRWKMKGTVTGRFGVEQGSWNPLTIAEKDRDRIVPSAPDRRIAVLDFRAMDACSIVSLFPSLEDRYGDATDLHGRTAELIGIDRDVAKKELFVFAYGGRSQYEDRFAKHLPEIMVRRGAELARRVQETSAIAFRAGLSRALPLLFGDETRPMFAVHDELVLDVVQSPLPVLVALEQGASDRIGRPYTVGVKIGNDYGEAKEP